MPASQLMLRNQQESVNQTASQAKSKLQMKSAITVSLVPESRGGPFVFWDHLESAIQQAAELGFDAIEIFPPDPDFLRNSQADKLTSRNGISIAAVGSGAGWVKHRLSLADPNPEVRAAALNFLFTLLETAADLGAPIIIGSMQGRSGPGVSKETAQQWLRHALEQLDPRALQLGTRVFYEPLNRYETDQCNTLAQGSQVIRGLQATKLLADWFHMNIEESDMASAIRSSAADIGHIHFADTNRHAIGFGHLNPEPLVQTLLETKYTGYLSAEVLPLPNSLAAAQQIGRAHV